MKLYSNPGSDDRCSAYPGKNGPIAGLPAHGEVLRVHWSGFGCSWDRPVVELEACCVPRLEDCERHPVSGDEMMRLCRHQRRTGWPGWPHYVDIAHVFYRHGDPDADTAAVVVVLHYDAVGHSLYTQDPLFP